MPDRRYRNPLNFGHHSVVSTPAEDRRQTAIGEGYQWRRWAPLALVAAAGVVVVAMGWHRELSLENLVRYRGMLDEFVAGHRAGALATFVGLYVVVVALSLPAAGFLTLSSGILFGTALGAFASIVGATIGAIAIFLIARTAFGEHLARRAGPLVARLAEGFRKDAFCYLLSLRLIPVFPFFVINLVAALAGVRLAPFIAATALGIIPAAFALAFVGAGVDSVIAAQEVGYQACLAAGGADCRLNFDLKSAFTPQLIAALAALGAVALIPLAVNRIRAHRAASD